MSNRTVPAAAEGMPAISEPLFTFAIDPTILARMAIKDLRHLHEGALAICDVVSGFGCQPRFQKRGVMTPAGDVLDDLNELVATIVSAAHDEAERRSAFTKADATDRAWIMLQREAYAVDCFERVASMVVTLTASIDAAEAAR